MSRGVRPFSLLIKPAGADCNLRCRYCFYLDRCSLYPDQPRHRMPDAVLEQTVRSFMATPQPVHAFGWQGGEPTLMGEAFFKRVTALQQRYGAPGAQVSNGLQTNATLIDDTLAAHLAQYRFLVGVSLDGPPELHDPNRITTGGRGTHADVLRGIDALRRHAVEFNVLTLVNRLNVGAPETVYDYLVDQGVLFHQYIECVEFDTEGRLLPFATDGAAWGEFLCRLFDHWYARDVRKVSVRLFDAILARIVEGRPNCCSMGNDCRDYFVVEHNGDNFPCDFYVYPEWRLGNVAEVDWAALQTAPAYVAFGARKRQRHPACEACDYALFCAGDCPKNRVGHVEGWEASRLSPLCAGWRRFYAHALPRLRELAATIQRERRRHPPPSPAMAAAPGRNQPCPCGSGRKTKHCCGATRLL